MSDTLLTVAHGESMPGTKLVALPIFLLLLTLYANAEENPIQNTKVGVVLPLTGEMAFRSSTD